MFGASALVGCNKDETASTGNSGNATTQPAQSPGEKVGNAVSNAVNSTTKGAEKAANAVGAAVSPTGADSLAGTKNAIQGVVEKATDKNNFKAVASYFTKADEERIDKTKPDTADLDAQIDAFQKAWNGKYGHNFKVKDVAADYPDSFISVAQDSADPNKATATVVASHDMPELKVPFVREGPQWRIDIPDDVDGPVLHSKLLATITTLNQGATSWPNDEVQATQAVTHAIMAAVLNK
jgi:hypothetical protein